MENWQNIGVSTKNASKDFVQEHGGVYNDRVTEKNSNINEGRWDRRRGKFDSDNQFGDSERTRRNAEIYATKSYSNQQASNIENKGNNRKQEVDDSASFNLSKDNTESKHNIISGLPTAQKQNDPSMANNKLSKASDTKPNTKNILLKRSNLVLVLYHYI